MNLLVGDLCVITEVALPEHFRGMECVITGALEWLEEIYDPITHANDPGLYYEILIQGEQYCRYAKPHELRLRRPKAWDDFIFDTSDVEHENKVSV